MRLTRTAFEVIVSGSMAELAEIGRKIAALASESTLAMVAECEQLDYAKLVVIENGGTFRASWHPSDGLLVQGPKSVLSAFADQFVFQCEPAPGLHNHWDLAATGLVDRESLAIVVQLS